MRGEGEEESQSAYILKYGRFISVGFGVVTRWHYTVESGKGRNLRIYKSRSLNLFISLSASTVPYQINVIEPLTP